MLKNGVLGYAVLIGASAVVLPEAAGSIVFICVGMYGAERLLTK